MTRVLSVEYVIFETVAGVSEVIDRCDTLDQAIGSVLRFPITSQVSYDIRVEFYHRGEE